MSETQTTAAPDEWAIVEIMGHLRRAGRISEQERFGARLLRLDVPIAGEDGFATEYFSGASIYRLRPCEEQVARDVGGQLGDPRPVTPLAYRLPGTVQGEEPTYAERYDD